VTADIVSYWLTDDGSCRSLDGQVRASCEPFSAESFEPSAGDAATTDGGLAAGAGGSRSIVVRLPAAPQNVSGVLLELPKRPRIHKQRMGVQQVVAGERAHIVIPGTHLWRSPKVTLGNRVAAGITVLPDMNGIIAEFEKFEAPPELTQPGPSSPGEAKPVPSKDAAPSDAATKLVLTVWTSDGRDSDTEHVRLVRRPATATPAPTPARASPPAAAQ
jgi:hypothetical protein